MLQKYFASKIDCLALREACKQVRNRIRLVLQILHKLSLFKLITVINSWYPNDPCQAWNTYAERQESLLN